MRSRAEKSGRSGNAQVHGGDTGETPIAGIQGRRDGAEAGHDSLDCGRVLISAAEQAFDLALLAHDKARAVPRDERRAAEHETIGRAGQSEILVTCLAETPELYRHGDAVFRVLRDYSQR